MKIETSFAELKRALLQVDRSDPAFQKLCEEKQP
jgi:hypothetical protein